MTVKVGIIGCGKITERASVPNLLNYKKKCKIVCLCDSVKEQAQGIAEKFDLNDVDIVSDYRKLLKRKDIDAVFVNIPNSLHEAVAVDAAKAGKHILVEKPMAVSANAARKMVTASKKAKKILMIEQTQRFDPLHQAAKKFLDTGALGKLHMIKGKLGHASPKYWMGGNPKWFNNRKYSGGGAIIDVGIHILDLLRWLSGKEVAEVCANVGTIEKRFNVDDNGSVLLRFKDGAFGQFDASWTCRPYEVSTWFYGEKGCLRTFMGAEKVIVAHLATAGKSQDPNCLRKNVYPKVKAGSGWGNAVHHFIDCILQGKKPFTSGEEGVKSLSVVLAAYESAKKGRWVKVRY